MAEPEAPKEWFVTREGTQYGPVSFDDLNYERTRGELNPRLDMLWKEGMADWVPAGEVEGLFEKNPTTLPSTEPSTGLPDECPRARMIVDNRWPGATRSSYLIITLLFPVFWTIALQYGIEALAGRLEPDLLVQLHFWLGFVPVLLALIIVLKRFQNLVMSRAWVLGLPVPFLNLWLGYRLTACPPGYAAHKKLDGAGWLLAILYWLLIIAVIGSVSYAAFILNQPAGEGGERETILELIRKLEEDIKAR